MSDWIKDSSIDHLRKIRGSRLPNSLEYRAVDEEIRRREAEEAKKEAERVGRLESQRHEEAVALKREEIDTKHYANRLSKWAIWISLIALAIAVVSLGLQLSGVLTDTLKPHSPVLSAAPTNTPVGVSKP
jgi:hypothetical protein